MASKRQRLKQLAKKRLNNSKIQNRIIDAITISFGAQNLIGNSLAAGGDLSTRFKNIVNEALGKTTGLNLFPDAMQFQQTFNPAGVVNPQTTAGVAALIYNFATKFVPQLPLKAESRRFAKKNIAVGIATGIFNTGSSGFGINTNLITSSNPVTSDIGIVP